MEPGEGNEIWRVSLKDELSRIEESATYSAQGQFETAKAWRAANNWLGGLAAVAATIAGSAALASESLRVLAGVLSLIAAAIGAVITTATPAAKAQLSTESGNKYLSLQAQSRQARDVYANQQEQETANRKLKQLTERQEEINSASPLIPKWAYKRAQKGINEGDQRYSVDK